jgi:hypothetical protein
MNFVEVCSLAFRGMLRSFSHKGRGVVGTYPAGRRGGSELTETSGGDTLV